MGVVIMGVVSKWASICCNQLWRWTSGRKAKAYSSRKVEMAVDIVIAMHVFVQLIQLFWSASSVHAQLY